jgi:hypothetical protein
MTLRLCAYDTGATAPVGLLLAKASQRARRLVGVPFVLGTPTQRIWLLGHVGDGKRSDFLVGKLQATGVSLDACQPTLHSRVWDRPQTKPTLTTHKNS